MRAHPSFTVVSYNIHRGKGLDGRVDLSRIASVLGEIDADVVGVQEVFEPQAEKLAETLGMRLAMGVTHGRLGGQYGNALLTRFDVQATLAFDLSRPSREPRGGIRMDVLVGEQVLHLFNVHFGLRLRERAEQVELLIRQHILRDGMAGPRVLIGDLNEWFPGTVGRTLRLEFHGPRIRRTHPAPFPLFPLDRIYWDRDLHEEGFHVHRSRLARVASDHLPVVASLRLAPRPRRPLAR
jgi:endonuclease/exonuclease/phosphatase family metal-dependent hydrolase